MFNLKLSELRALIPQYVIDVAEVLQKNGYQAYLVGGSLRDVLMGKIPDDYDIATNAYPEEVEKIYTKSIPTGAKFGVMTVVVEDNKGERHDVEITTYRSDADYLGGRWPSKVEYTKTIEEDLSRRDFTINAMALNLQEFDTVDDDRLIHQLLVDPFKGLQDMDAKLVRAVGNPVERFTEDGLRPMRGCRFASQLEFAIDPETFAAMKETNHITKMVSAERLRDELMKLLLKSPKPSVGLLLLKDSGILELLIPELLEGIEVVQPQFHVDDVFTHLLKTVDAAEDNIKLAALLHDIAKPRTRSIDASGIHFYGHDMLGAQMTEEIMRRLRFSNDEIDRTTKLVRWHMFYYPSSDWRKGKNIKYLNDDEFREMLKETSKYRNAAGWTDGAVRRLIIAVGGEDAIDDLIKLRIADASANPKSEFNPAEMRMLSERIAEVRSKDMALKVSDLDITGNDLMQSFNLQPGPVLGEVLNHLLDLVVDDPLLNEKAQLLSLAGEYLRKI